MGDYIGIRRVITDNYNNSKTHKCTRCNWRGDNGESYLTRIKHCPKCINGRIYRIPSED